MKKAAQPIPASKRSRKTPITPAHHHHDGGLLVISSVLKEEFVYVDSAGTRFPVSVTQAVPKDSITNEVVVDTSSGAIPVPELSLYTLGIQGRLWNVFLLKVEDPDQTGFKLRDSAGRVFEPGTGPDRFPIMIPGTGVIVTPSGLLPPNEDAIWFFVQERPGVVKLTLFSGRVVHTKTVYDPSSGPFRMLNHNNTPPPPKPGGPD